MECALGDSAESTTRLVVVTACACALVYKKSLEGQERDWVEFALDASKQALGALWAWLLEVLLFGAGTNQCNDFWLRAVLDLTLVLLMEVLVLCLVVSVLCSVNGNAGDYATGVHWHADGSFAMEKYGKQLGLWFGCILCAKWGVSRLLLHLGGALETICGTLLMPVSWSPMLELAVVAVLTPGVATVAKVWITDDFLRAGGSWWSEAILGAFAAKLPAPWRELPSWIRKEADLDRPFLQAERSQMPPPLLVSSARPQKVLVKNAPSGGYGVAVPSTKLSPRFVDGGRPGDDSAKEASTAPDQLDDGASSSPEPEPEQPKHEDVFPELAAALAGVESCLARAVESSGVSAAEIASLEPPVDAQSLGNVVSPRLCDMGAPRTASGHDIVGELPLPDLVMPPKEEEAFPDLAAALAGMESCLARAVESSGGPGEPLMLPAPPLESLFAPRLRYDERQEENRGLSADCGDNGEHDHWDGTSPGLGSVESQECSPSGRPHSPGSGLDLDRSLGLSSVRSAQSESPQLAELRKRIADKNQELLGLRAALTRDPDVGPDDGSSSRPSPRSAGAKPPSAAEPERLACLADLAAASALAAPQERPFVPPLNLGAGASAGQPVEDRRMAPAYGLGTATPFGQAFDGQAADGSGLMGGAVPSITPTSSGSRLVSTFGLGGGSGDGIRQPQGGRAAEDTGPRWGSSRGALDSRISSLETKMGHLAVGGGSSEDLGGRISSLQEKMNRLAAAAHGDDSLSPDAMSESVIEQFLGETPSRSLF